MPALNANQIRHNTSSNHIDDDVEELRRYRQKKRDNTGPLPKRTRRKRRTETTKPTQQLYSDMLDAWARFKEKLGDPDIPPDYHNLTTFFWDYARSSRGRLCKDKHATIDTVVQKIGRFACALNEKQPGAVSTELMDNLFTWAWDELKEELGLPDGSFEKYYASWDDVQIFVRHSLLEDKHVYHSRRFRAQIVAIFLLIADHGERLGAILQSSSYRGDNIALRWKHVRLFIKPSLQPDVPAKLWMQIQYDNRKGERLDPNEYFEQSYHERADIAHCLVYWFVLLAFLDNAFEEFSTPAELLGRQNHGPGDFTVKFKEDMLEVPIFRAMEKVGSRTISKTLAWSASSATREGQRIVLATGIMIYFTFYCIRRGVFNRFADSGVAVGRKQQAMGHQGAGPSDRIFKKYYRSRQFVPDIGNVFRGEAPRVTERSEILSMGRYRVPKEQTVVRPLFEELLYSDWDAPRKTQRLDALVGLLEYFLTPEPSRARHPKEPTHHCEVCNKPFANPGNVRRHQNESRTLCNPKLISQEAEKVEEGDSHPYRCGKCGAGYPRFRGLQYHQTKSQTTCNPNFTPLRPSVTPITVEHSLPVVAPSSSNRICSSLDNANDSESGTDDFEQDDIEQSDTGGSPPVPALSSLKLNFERDESGYSESGSSESEWSESGSTESEWSELEQTRQVDQHTSLPAPVLAPTGSPVDLRLDTAEQLLLNPHNLRPNRFHLRGNLLDGHVSIVESGSALSTLSDIAMQDMPSMVDDCLAQSSSDSHGSISSDSSAPDSSETNLSDWSDIERNLPGRGVTILEDRDFSIKNSQQEVNINNRKLEDSFELDHDLRVIIELKDIKKWEWKKIGEYLPHLSLEKIIDRYYDAPKQRGKANSEIRRLAKAQRRKQIKRHVSSS